MATPNGGITARDIAVRLTLALGRTVSPKQVRGRARGDSGTALLDRYAPGAKPAYAAHVYSPAEADAIVTAFVASHTRRGGQPVEVEPFAPVEAEAEAQPEAEGKSKSKSKSNAGA